MSHFPTWIRNHWRRLKLSGFHLVYDVSFAKKLYQTWRTWKIIGLYCRIRTQRWNKYYELFPWKDGSAKRGEPSVWYLQDQVTTRNSVFPETTLGAARCILMLMMMIFCVKELGNSLSLCWSYTFTSFTGLIFPRECTSQCVTVYSWQILEVLGEKWKVGKTFNVLPGNAGAVL